MRRGIKSHYTEGIHLHSASNVDMRPTERCIFLTGSRFDTVNKRLQEQRSGAGAGRPATRLEQKLVSRTKYNNQDGEIYVAQVSVRGMDLGAIVFIEGQTPESVILGLPSNT